MSEVAIRYRQPARFDDQVRVRCWVRAIASRRVEFGYAVEHAGDGRLLATATVALLALDASLALRRLPDDVTHRLRVVPDPVRLGLGPAAGMPIDPEPRMNVTASVVPDSSGRSRTVRLLCR